ncbi:MAG: L,D-transpeptidase family protein [Pseudomonadota bacterium]
MRFAILAPLRVLAELVFAAALLIAPAHAEVTAFKQAIAEAASDDADIAAFYRTHGYAPIWTGPGAEGRTRRAALMKALSGAGAHGLPPSHYDAEGLMARMKAARTQRDRGALEVEISRVFLRYARDVQTGLLIPQRVDSGIVRQVPYRDRASYLVNFTRSSPTAFFRALPPQNREYTALMKEKMRLEARVAAGGWGPNVPANALKPGASGQAVIALRNRLMAQGYLARTSSRTYDAALEAAVQRFQTAHGLEADGVAGPGTITEMNISAAQRLRSVVVAMERERWINQDRGARHILVNIPDFSARVMDNGTETFRTRSVVGARTEDRPTPEFSDVMEHMVINPSWYVPRSIIVGEYLPRLRANPGAVSHLQITDSRGRVVSRNRSFASYTERTFPFSMRQPPGPKNALGLVKFMFPNKHNIYLHDTPAKNLFGREVRAYSHGCVRLAEPFEFAYALLAAQEDDPKAFFQTKLRSGQETYVYLDDPVPVHLIYRTAFTKPKGGLEFRRDVYGRDAKVWEALRREGVVLGGASG